MPGAGRMNDKAQCTSHTCKKKVCCSPPHSVIGPANITSAKKTHINGRPALRVGDKGTHSSCCGENMWEAMRCTGEHKVFIEGKPAFRVNDITLHCKKDQGFLIEGSPDVIVGG
jgi:uncharacterized Zn-binding protein involved in type VI secretion